MKHWAYYSVSRYYHLDLIENMDMNILNELLSGIFDNPYHEGNEDAYRVWGFLGDQSGVFDRPAHSWEVRKTGRQEDCL